MAFDNWIKSGQMVQKWNCFWLCIGPGWALRIGGFFASGTAAKTGHHPGAAAKAWSTVVAAGFSALGHESRESTAAG